MDIFFANGSIHGAEAFSMRYVWANAYVRKEVSSLFFGESSAGFWLCETRKLVRLEFVTFRFV